MHTKVERVIDRPGFGPVRILANLYVDWNYRCSCSVDVFRRAVDGRWKLCSDEPKMDKEAVRRLGSEAYERSGRPEFLVVAGLGQILKTSQMALEEAKRHLPPGAELKKHLPLQ